MDESRKQFAEAFEELTGWELEDYPNQDYADTCWEFWKMSRATIEIELPKYHDYTSQDTTRAQAEKSAYNSGIYDSAEAILAAGLKVKGE